MQYIILYVRMQYSFQKSYCTSECSIPFKIILYVQVQYIVLYIRVQYSFQNSIVRSSVIHRTVHPSAVFLSKSYCTSECNTSYCTTECSISFKNCIVRPSAIYCTVRPSAIYPFIIHIVRPSVMYLSYKYYIIQHFHAKHYMTKYNVFCRVCILHDVFRNCVYTTLPQFVKQTTTKGGKL